MRPGCPLRWGRSITSCIAGRPIPVPAPGSWLWKFWTAHRIGSNSVPGSRMRRERRLRLRQKVVVPTLPTASPRWVVDPDFNLDFHVRRMRVPEPGSLRQLLDIAELMVQSPLDIARPLWTVTLIEGLPDGKAATLLHLSHAVTDGVGSVEMFAHIYDLERDPPAQPTPAQPIPQDLSPNDLMREGLNQLPVNVAKGAGGALWGAASMVGRAVSRPSAALSGALSYARSGARVVSRAAEPSPLLRRRSLATRSEAIDIPLSDLHRAAKAGGGSINDAYLAASERRFGPLPRSARRADLDTADGGAGQPAGRVRRRRRQPLHRCQLGGPDRYDGSGRSHAEDPLADDAAPRRARDGHHRLDCAAAEHVAGAAAGIDDRFRGRLRRAGQQRAGLSRRHLPGRLQKCCGSTVSGHCPVWR